MCLCSLTQVLLNNNDISSIADNSLQQLHFLMVLDLSDNKMTSFKKHSLSGPRNLKVLILYKNNILFVNRMLFTLVHITFVVTDNFHVCCLFSDSNTLCSLHSLWPFSCKCFLIHSGLKILCWCIGLLTIIANFLSILFTSLQGLKAKQLKNYDRYVIAINACDLLTGLVVLLIAVKDVSLGENYMESDLRWRSSIECHLLAMFSLWSILCEAWFVMIISIARFRVVKDPFEEPFDEFTGRGIFIIIPMTYAIIIITLFALRQQRECISFLPSDVCNLLGRTDESITQKVATVLLSVCLLAILATTLFFYKRLLEENKKTGGILSESKKREREKVISKTVVLAGTSKSLCWIPSSAFYLLSLVVDEYPVVILQWMALVVLPFNAIMNPIVFNLSTIREKLKLCMKKCT